MKKWISWTLAVTLMLLCLAGCGGNSNDNSSSSQPQDSSQGGDASSSGAAQAEYTLKFGHDHTTTSPFHTASLSFKEQVERESGGRISVEIYPSQSLGSAREMIEMMQMGTLEATLLPTAKFGGFDQRLNLADMPFLADTEEDFMSLLNGPIGAEAMAGLEDIGIKGIAYFPEGFKYITNNARPITSPADLNGLKIRTMEAPIIMSMFKCWGANPVPIDFSEVYNSLQQGVVDGEENPLLSIHDMRFYEVQKYMTIDSHAYLSYFLSYSKAWFDQLPADLQEVVLQAGIDAKDYCQELMNEANAEYLRVIEASGTEIYTLSAEETAAFKEACQSVYEEYRDIIGGDLLDRAVAESARLASERG